MSVRDLKVGCDRFAVLSDRQAVGEPIHIEDEIFLTRHARHCETCRAEMALYDALPDILSAPRQSSLAAVTTRAPIVGRSRIRAWLLVAAAVSAGGAAAAELVLVRPTLSSSSAGISLAPPVIDPPAVPQRTRSTRTAPVPSLEELLPEPQAPASSPPITAEPASPPPPRPAVLEARGTTAIIPTARLGTAAPPSEAEVPMSSPNDILREARALRARGRSQEAVAAYGRLIREYPRSPEARTARVSVGDLQLGPLADPAAALASFDAYLSGGPGALALEARYGRIRALGALGRAGEEQREIGRFVQEFPGTVQAKNLTARMNSLHP